MAEDQVLTFGHDARPAAAPVEEADLDGEIVLYNPVDHRIHHLDRTGSLVWQLLDGDATVGELIEDISAAFGTPADVVEVDLLALLTDLHGEGLLVDSSSSALAEAFPSDHLSDPANPCESDAGRLAFGDAFAIRLAGKDVSLRTSPEITDGLREILRQHVVDRDPTGAPAHFSAYVPGTPSEVNRLYHGSCPRTRSVDPSRVVRSMVDHAAMALPPIPGTMSVYARAAIVDGERAVLLPHVIDQSLQRWDARLREAGVVLTDAPVLGLDVDAGEIVLCDRLGVGPAIDELVAHLPTRRREAPPADGRYPIDRWWFMWFIGKPGGTLSRAQAARRAAQTIDPGRDLDADLLRHIGSLFDRVEACVGDLDRADPIRMILGTEA